MKGIWRDIVLHHPDFAFVVRFCAKPSVPEIQWKQTAARGMPPHSLSAVSLGTSEVTSRTREVTRSSGDHTKHKDALSEGVYLPTRERKFSSILAFPFGLRDVHEGEVCVFRRIRRMGLRRYSRNQLLTDHLSVGDGKPCNFMTWIHFVTKWSNDQTDGPPVLIRPVMMAFSREVQ